MVSEPLTKDKDMKEDADWDKHWQSCEACKKDVDAVAEVEGFPEECKSYHPFKAGMDIEKAKVVSAVRLLREKIDKNFTKEMKRLFKIEKQYGKKGDEINSRCYRHCGMTLGINAKREVEKAFNDVFGGCEKEEVRNGYPVRCSLISASPSQEPQKKKEGVGK